MTDTLVVNTTLLTSIKDFMDDLSTVMSDNENFNMYHSIVKKIDETKVNSYRKLVEGFRVFFDDNESTLNESNLKDLNNPMIAYSTNTSGTTTTFAFNFENAFNELDVEEQKVVKEHLDHIWRLLKNPSQSPEEMYIDKIFDELKTKFASKLSDPSTLEEEFNREQQMTLARELFEDFQKQHLDIGVVVKIACKKARELLPNSDPESNALCLISEVENIDINNFNIVQFFALIGKVGTMFSDKNGDNPLQSLLSNVFSQNALFANNMDNLTLESLSNLSIENNETVDEEVAADDDTGEVWL